MNPLDLQPALSKLRSDLEELLAIVSREIREATANTARTSSSAPEAANHDSTNESTEISASIDARGSNDHDRLIDDALVVITEFGQATPAILQMWLSVDYVRASRILGELEVRGLVSPKGRVRHKAYELRRASGMEFRL